MPKGPHPITREAWRAGFRHPALSNDGRPLAYPPVGARFPLGADMRATCPEHGDYVLTAGRHQRAGCPSCGRARSSQAASAARSKQATALSKRDVTGKLADAGFLYATSGKRLDLSRLPAKTRLDTVVTVVCPDHGPRTVRVAQLLSGRCPGCSQESRSESSKQKVSDKLSLFPTDRAAYLSSIKHDSLSTRGQMDTLVRAPALLHRDDVLSVRCADHGLFERPAGRYRLYRGCPGCKADATSVAGRASARTRQEWLDARTASGLDGAGKAVTYLDLQENVTSLDRITVRCSIHGDTQQFAAYHLLMRGTSCPHCNAAVTPPQLRDFPLSAGLRARLTSHARPHSQPERALAESLHAHLPSTARMTLQFSQVFSDKRVSLDIYLPDYKVGVEINGVYWHQDLEGSKPTRHQKKSVVCRSAGVTLLQFTDLDIENNLPLAVSMILAKCGLFKLRMYARNLRVLPVAAHQARSFLLSNHISGFVSGSTYLGLFHGDRLASVAVFGKSRFSKKASHELLRFATRKHLQVVGGLDRLVSQWRRENPTSSLLSFADMRYSNASSYRASGWVLSHETPPGYTYYHTTRPPVTRYGAQKHRLSKLLGPSFDAALSESVNMKACGYYRLYDAGHSLFLKPPLLPSTP